MRSKFQWAILSSPFLLFCTVVGFRRPISDDESIFIYGAQQISRGDFFMVDFWDHKGPLLYWLNVISINVPLPNFLGIAVLQGLITSFSLYYSLNRLQLAGISSRTLVMFSLTTSITLMSVILNLNSTEGWSIPFQFFCYTILLAQLLNPQSIETSARNVVLYAVALGLSLSVIVLIRINNGFGVFIATMFVIWNLRTFRRKFLIAWSFTLALVLTSTVLLYALSGNLQAIFDKYYVYNSDYSSGMSFSRRLFGFNYLVFNYIKSPIFVLVVVLLILIFSLRHLRSKKLALLGTVAVIDFFAQSLSGRGNRQYIPATIVILLIVSVYLLHLLEKNSQVLSSTIAFSLFVIYSISALSLENLESSWHSGYKSQISDSQFVEKVSRETKSIYYYGPSPQALVRNNIKNLSQFIYIAPALSFFSRNQSELAEQLTLEVQSNRPQVILRDLNSCAFNLEICYEGNEQYLSEQKALADLRQWILNNYVLSEVNGNLELWSRRDR